MAKTDILAAPAKIYYAPVGETLPDETTVAAGAAWGGTWVDLGYTLTPVSVNLETETFDLFVEQNIAPVRRVRTALSAAFETTLAEFTGAVLALVMDGTKTTTAPGASQKGYDEVTVSGEKADVSMYAFGIEGVRVLANNTRQPVRIFIMQGSITASGAIEFSKSAGAGIPVTIGALADANGHVLKIHNVTAEATS